ncbi:MAG: GTPase HflX [Acidaminococcaceae bacterium]|nr:GTPase HflX [Acidaminococcaceae bacterium]
MPEVLGNLKGIRNSVIEELNKIYDCHVDNSQIVSQELVLNLAKITNIINREISVYLDRAGAVQSVCVGDNNTVSLPNINNRRGEKHLSGIRCLHTHPGGSAELSGIDLSALRLNRYDAMIAIGVHPTDIDKSLLSFAIITGYDENGEFTLSVCDPVCSEQAESIFFPNLVATIEKSLAANDGATNLNKQQEKAVLVGMEYNGMDMTLGWTPEDSLEELKQLADTAGAVVVKQFLQKRPTPDRAYVIGRGKVQELALFAQQENIDLCIFDDELSPAQQRNIEEAMGIHVIDRTGLILDIFAQRARSNEGKLQVELAQLQYMLPRIMGKGLALSRLGGGIGTRGAGETKLELDRRHIRDRIAFIKNSIEKVKGVRDLHREGRAKAEVPTISLVGYTNAGKSTLLNVLTNSDIYAKDQLFATLDPTSRQLILPDKQETVLTDTVGFIQRLPHQLVAAFQSTLEDTINADVLLHVIDVSHPLYQEQSNAVYKVLEELQIKDKPIITVYNKIDKLPDNSELLVRLQNAENAVCVSAKQNINLDKLLQLIAQNLKLKSLDDYFYIPYTETAMVSKLHELGTVVEEEYLADCSKVHAIISTEYLNMFEKYLKK